ncbi:MAG: InlB B-repeat-containing protein [Bacilli bacterium]|nr:InlB B-repeat-containing protein [Bacilli bacterium]
MRKRLNNKGYMLVEIIVASVIAFSIAYYLLNLTYKFKNKNMDVYESTALLNAKINITKNIMNDLLNDNYEIINADNNSVTLKTTKNDQEIIKKIIITKDSNDTTIEYGTYKDNSFLTNDNSYYKKVFPTKYLEVGNIIRENNSVIIPINNIYSKKTYNIKIVTINAKNSIAQPNDIILISLEQNEPSSVTIKITDPSCTINNDLSSITCSSNDNSWVTLPEIESENQGYVFGWSGLINGTKIDISSGGKKIITSQSIFYPIALPNVYGLNFSPNGGNYPGSTSTRPLEGAVFYNDSHFLHSEVYGGMNYLDDLSELEDFIAEFEIPIPTPSKTGYIFNGWYTEENGGQKVLNTDGSFTGTKVEGYTNGSSWTMTEDKILYAHWQ